MLRQAGLKSTNVRLSLLSVLEQSKKPMSIAELIKALNGKLVNQATVYRTLNSLVQAKLVRQVDLRHGHVDYEMIGRHDHHHLVCTRCGRIEDFIGCDAKTIIAKAVKKSKHFRLITDHSFELYGRCRSCQLLV